MKLRRKATHGRTRFKARQVNTFMVCGKDLGSGFLINLEKLTQAFLKFLYLKFSTAPLNVLCCFEGTGVNRPLPFSQRYQDQPDEDIADDYEEALGRLQLSFYFRNQCVQ